MPTKYNNMLTIRLTDEQTDWLIDLMNKNYCINSMADAVRYCINSEIHYSKLADDMAWDGTKKTK